MRKLVPPLIFLLLLLGAWYFRWDYTASKTLDIAAVVKWKTDRWTGQQWIVQYTASKILETPNIEVVKTTELDPELESLKIKFAINPDSVSKENQAALKNYLKEKIAAQKLDEDNEQRAIKSAWEKRKLFTWIWQASMVFSVLWFLYVSSFGPWLGQRKKLNDANSIGEV